eukprot:TRINITY_DN40890_c2_g1_i1.p3 TRINITY_DN40890_c2_g1~~TRINITY_DN40890_c2_g1_i1.p3  ORF type:complete len:53 (-),score=0.19 TRINITY_DN40890_c2_g1_i1:10-168(-)
MLSQYTYTDSSIYAASPYPIPPLPTAPSANVNTDPTIKSFLSQLKVKLCPIP